MAEKKINKNQVIMSGIIDTQPVYCYTLQDEKYYAFDMNVLRKSGRADIIPMTIGESLIDREADMVGMYMEIHGQFRSANRIVDGRNRLILTVHVQRVICCMKRDSNINAVNSIYLDGFISRKPLYRRTPMGREITEMMMAVNRKHSADYIPCICWGNNARQAQHFPLGTHIKVWGRIQSREYRKWLVSKNGEDCITRTAYEISIGRFEVPEMA